MPKRVSHVVMCAAAMLAAPAVSGCKEDPPPPPPVVAPTGDASATPAPAMSGRQRAKIKRVDADTTKRSRIEACYWGSMGLAVTRDAYLASMKGKTLSADNLPDFGTFPEHVKRAEAMKKAGREPQGRATNMPYLRHLRACKHAKSAAGVPLGGADEALAAWEPYASQLHEALVKSTRYYARKSYEKDEFAEGKKYNDTLLELLPQYDEKLAAFTAAVDKWREGDKAFKLKVELDEGGKVAVAALEEARQLAVAMSSSERNKESIDKLLASLDKAVLDLETLREEQRRPPHPKVVGPKLAEFVTATKELAAAEGKLDAAKLYPVTSGLALLYELNQRSLEQLVRQRSTKRKPMRTLGPRQAGGRKGGGAGDGAGRIRGVKELKPR